MKITHHQRKHVKNAKLSLFDVGMRDLKAGKIYDVSDPEKQRKLPQHDFSNPQVHVTP
jgi:hypothetical protein